MNFTNPNDRLGVPSPIVINHVMSSDAGSGIFHSILKYFRLHSPSSFEHLISQEPLPDADIYHYHRPNLEKKLHKPAIATVHHDIDDTDRWFRFSNFVGQYKQCDKIICLNTLQRKRLMDLGIPKTRLEVVPHGVNSQLLKLCAENDVGVQREKLNIGITSRRYGRRVKGDAYLYELSKRIDPSKFRFTLMGVDRTITAMDLRTLGFECLAFDRLPYRMIQSIYDEMDVLMMCSLYEGGPANIPEALTTGTPVLTSKIGMAADLVKEGENGAFLTMNPDIDAKMLSGLVSENFAKFSELSETAKQVPIKPLTWQDVTKQHNDIYRDTVLQKNRSQKMQRSF